jgi:hypothetical protein
MVIAERGLAASTVNGAAPSAARTVLRHSHSGSGAMKANGAANAGGPA